MRSSLIGASALFLFIACSSNDSETPPVNNSGTGGGVGMLGTGGSALGTGGAGTVPTGGVAPATGGAVATGGVSSTSTGGVWAQTGGFAPLNTGGFLATGGFGVATGGVTVPLGTGGVSVATGGTLPVATGGVDTGPTGGTDTGPTGGTEETGGTTETGGGEPVDNGPWAVKGGGFVTSGLLSGYAWTNDTDGFGDGFEDIKEGDELCASGVVETSSNYSNVGMIGWNISQDSSGDDIGNGCMELSGEITVKFSNAGGTPLRIQMKGSKGEWCADLGSSSSGTKSFDLSELVTECWGEDGDAYDGECVEAISLMAPGDGGDEGEDRDVEMCLLEVTVE